MAQVSPACRQLRRHGHLPREDTVSQVLPQAEGRWLHPVLPSPREPPLPQLPQRKRISSVSGATLRGPVSNESSGVNRRIPRRGGQSSRRRAASGTRTRYAAGSTARRSRRRVRPPSGGRVEAPSPRASAARRPSASATSTPPPKYITPPASNPAAAGIAGAKGPAHVVPNSGAERSTSAPEKQTTVKPSFVARCPPPAPAYRRPSSYHSARTSSSGVRPWCTC